MAITKAERAELKKLPIQGYCDWKNIPYTRPSSSEIRMVDHDSLVVRPKMNLFVWNSTGVKGDLVDFIHYYELGKSDGDSKGEAIRQQLSYARYVKGADVDIDKLYKSNQPDYQFDYKQVFRTKYTGVAKDYLVNQRKLSADFVDNLIKRGDVAQGSRYKEYGEQHANSVIFPWKDVNGKIVGADRQGTEQDFEHYKKRGTSKKIAPGSDTSTGYNLSFGKGDQTLVLFESPIDLLSYAQQNYETLKQYNATLLSVSGTDAKRGAYFLNDSIAAKQARFNKIIVAFDNDKAGFKAADFYERHTYRNPITNEPIIAERQIPLKGKDWNEQLKAGVSGFKSLSMTENAKRLEQLEVFGERPENENKIINKDTQESKIPAKKERSNKTPIEDKSLKLDKAQRRRENEKKNKAIIKEAMSKVTQYQQDPKALQSLLDFTATSLNYSARNSIIMKLQRPDATLVKGYKQWEDNKIQVNKGEKGMRIFGAPVDLKTIIDTNGERVFWKDATPEQKNLANRHQLEVQTIKHYPTETVFDVRQTNATLEQIPELLPNRPINLATDKSPIHLDNAYKSLKKYADDIKVTVYDQGVDDQLINRPMTWQGQAKGAFTQLKADLTKRFIFLRSDLTPTDKIHTLAHELAHAKLHDSQAKSNWSKAIKETQAELSSYVITKNLGIDPGSKSVEYIANWSNNLKSLDVKNTGKIINQALQASTDVTQFLSQNLAQGEVKQVTHQKNSKQTQTTVVEKKQQSQQRQR
ncbi:toprim domain-containing protein [Leuconostoc citreum]|uniref:toprim domain-containing protein n=1 Tax=Leuconostoc citreum TaxID=33964 RepID=UPI00200B4D24|nr:toprim domain-containing protein [Leuconostoc citreum]MCK8605738.1 toprim domain-containing protein [Leuconostoc citreum]